MIVRLAAIVGVLSLLAAVDRGPADQAASASALFDQYNRGDYNAAVQAALMPGPAKGFSAFRAAFERAAPDWISAGGPAGTSRRRLVVATFILDIARAVYTSAQRNGGMGRWQDPRANGLAVQIRAIWQSDLRPMVEWACTMLRQDRTPAPLERQWFLASIQLFKDFSDPDASPLTEHDVDPSSGGIDAWTPGHLGHAVGRFPNEPWFRVVAAERRTDGLAAFALEGRDLSHVIRNDMRPDPVNDTRAAAAADFGRVREALSKLEDEASVRAEAHLYLGTIALVFAEHDRARQYLDDVAPWTADPCLIYLAHFVRGRVDELDGRRADAATAYRAALTAVPRAQSASTTLAALLWLDGRPADAAALVEASLAGPAIADDPWTAFYSGHVCTTWPTLMGNLRAGLR